MPLWTSVELAGHLPVLALTGDIDLSTVPKLHQALVQLADAHPGLTVALDLDGVESVEDAGLGIILGGAARTRELGGELVLVCSGVRLRERLSLTRLDRAVTVYPTIADAAAP